MTDTSNPPVAFYFTVSIDADTTPLRIDGTFQEVSGITTDLETEALAEGGENRFVHALPKGVKHGNLSLKRGIALVTSPLVNWTKQTLEGDFSVPIQPLTVTISLMGGEGNPLRAWSFVNAWPVKWEVAAFEAAKGEIAIEKLELAYSSVLRTV